MPLITYNPQTGGYELLSDAEAEAYFNALNPPTPQPIAIPPIEDETMLANKFEIGCDPEFAILNPSGGLVMCSSLGKDGPVGYDHSGRVAEVHPEKAKGTWTLIKRIAQILNECPKLADFRHSSKWRSGAVIKYANCNCGAADCVGKTVALGGHVHFNIPPSEWKPAYTAALDALSLMLEKLDILPEAECVLRRKFVGEDGHKYGHPGDLRNSNDGTHIEYRTMASWLFDPWISFLCLTSAKLAVAAPEVALTHLKGAPDKQKLANFIDAFRNKDINADRLLAKFERGSKWLNAQPDNDIKQVWSEL